MKDDYGNYAVFNEQGASASHTTAQMSTTLFRGYPDVLTHQNIFILSKKIAERFGSDHRKQEDHNIGTQLTIQRYRWSAIFAVIHLLDSFGREHLRKF